MFEKEIKEAVKLIIEIKAKKVLLQFADGLKPKASFIVDAIAKETGVVCSIWAGSCYGACDMPAVTGYDLIIQFGHNVSLKTGF
jgi:diphthamide biosynthesis enzyme Dph1/Dph2-like protein